MTVQVRSVRRPGHFWADNELLDVYGPQIGAYGFAVYMALSRYARNDSGECRVALGRIAASLAISTRTVQRAVEALERVGLLGVERVPAPERGRLHAANVYTLLEVSKGTPMTNSHGGHDCESGGPRPTVMGPHDSQSRGIGINKTNSTRLQDKTKTASSPSVAGEEVPVEPAAPADDAVGRVVEEFAAASGTAPKAADRRTARELLQQASVAVLVAGIWGSAARAKAPVRTLAYCRGCVEEFAKAGLGEAALAAATESARRMVQQRRAGEPP